MKSRNGIAPLLIIIVAVLLVTGTGGFLLVSKKQAKKIEPAPSMASQTPFPQIQQQAEEQAIELAPSPIEHPMKTSAPLIFQEKNSHKIQGLWRVRRAFVANQNGEWKETAVPFSLYTEFKSGQICQTWEIKNGAGTCKKYQSVVVGQDSISVRDPISPIIFQWNIIEDELELIELESGTNKPKTKTISEKAARVEFIMPIAKAPTPSKTIRDPKLLLGLWKLEKVLVYNPQDETWKESPGTTAVPYQEFTAKTLCSSSITMPGDEPEPVRFKCLSVTPYAVSQDIISFELPGLSGGKEPVYYRWNIVDAALELGVGISDQPFLKYIYAKAPVFWPTESFTIQLEDTNPPQKNKSFKVQGKRKTTETIDMWLTNETDNILSAEIASFWCSTLGAQTDICMTEVTGERADYSPKPDNPQCPFPEIPFGSHPKIGQVICFVPQADGQFQIELRIKNPGMYILHAKAIQSGVETKLPITISQ